MYVIDSPYRREVSDVLAAHGVDALHGLTREEASRRLAYTGPNALRERRRASLIQILSRQFRSAVVALLLAAAVLSAIFGDFLETAAVVIVIFVNAAIGFFTEWGAVRSMEALHRLGRTTARVRRGGHLLEIDASELVPGDIVELEAGDIVAADIRLESAHKLACDESALTGESVPVAKHTKALPPQTLLADRANMAYKGTSVTRGSGAGVVVGTGMQTELGAITRLVSEAPDEETPLERRLNELGRRLIWIILAIVALVAGLGVVRGKDPVSMVETAIALAVASIPEGLPIVATIALSRGLLRMARRQALVRRLSSVETLGSASVICTDKTGTLTENRLTVVRIETPTGRADRREDGSWVTDERARAELEEALKCGALCNNASLAPQPDGSHAIVGDPLEGALLIAAVENDLDPFALRREFDEVREEPFDSDTKLMATFHRQPGRGANNYYVAVKGAPETVLRNCGMDDADRVRWIATNDAIARDGVRMLAFACKEVGNENAHPYDALTFLGLCAMVDPPRRDVRASVESCERAGIRVVMVTGDHAATAQYVARSVGIVKDDSARVVLGDELRDPASLTPETESAFAEAAVFARVSPQQKLDLIALHQRAGEIVAMTGDGINDAPALKKADIGVAMGKRGTQVARDVADVVLKDDAFATIVEAVREGRIIYANIRKFVIYLMSCNVAEIVVIFAAALANSPLPVLPLQILFLNLVTDVFPALALGFGEGDPRVMARRPRPPGEPLVPRRLWVAIGGYSLYIAMATLTAFYIALHVLDISERHAVTISFMTLAVAQLIHVFDMRDHDAPLFINDVVRNRYVWGAIVSCAGLLGAADYLPILQDVLETEPLRLREWIVVGLCSVAPVILDVCARAIHETTRRSELGTDIERA